MAEGRCRRLLIVLGDQLSAQHPLIASLDPQRDRVFMAEIAKEACHVWSHKARIVLFLSAMRHFAVSLRSRGIEVRYLALEDHHHTTLSQALGTVLRELRPETISMLQAGDHRVQQSIEACVGAAGQTLEIVDDPHFFATPKGFQDWLAGRKQPRQEQFYRFMRKTTGILMDDGEPCGGRWNYDRDNRKRFGRQGPQPVAEVPGFAPDAITRAVIERVRERFAEHPGDLDTFDWPVCTEEAETALQRFIEQRLELFGAYQDAMWCDEPFLYHALLSSSLNLKLLDARAVVNAAERAYREGHVALNSAEGFIRQILGWREYVRGIYWARMPGYAQENDLQAELELPGFYWNGATDMACLREVIGQTLRYGYAHHIQRLMVTGLYALLLGVRPQQVHEWYLAVYVDAVEWVELPNTLGMSQYADGGFLASKPYVASGKYIKRMSNYCEHCRFDPDQAVGEEACPFTTLYWDFLQRHRQRFADHPRTALQWRNLERIDKPGLRAIRQRAERLRAGE